MQAHVSDVQARYNKMILSVKNKFGVSIIHANDSHYIYPNDSKYRDLFLKAKGMVYEDESDFILDYPDTKTIIERYKKQGVLSDSEIEEALNNTLIFHDAEGIHLDKEFKIPKINPEIIKKELHNSKIDCSNDYAILQKL